MVDETSCYGETNNHGFQTFSKIIPQFVSIFFLLIIFLLSNVFTFIGKDLWCFIFVFPNLGLVLRKAFLEKFYVYYY